MKHLTKAARDGIVLLRFSAIPILISANAVSRELQVPRSLPRVGDAAKWIATGPWRVSRS
jgi:hypothetical protein